MTPIFRRSGESRYLPLTSPFIGDFLAPSKLSAPTSRRFLPPVRQTGSSRDISYVLNEIQTFRFRYGMKLDEWWPGACVH